MRLSRYLSSVAIGAFYATSAFAADSAAAGQAPDEPSAEAPAEAPAESSEIVVTATKLGETALLRSAISAEVLGGSQLQDRRISDPLDLANSVTGLRLDKGSTAPKISIRGVGLDNYQLAAENGVASYVNGIVIQRSQAALVPFLDFERVDVLKGPQGTSFGRNATGGAINYIGNKPEAGFAAELGGGVGSFGRHFANGYVNFGSDEFAVRIAGKFDKDDGFARNLVTGNRVNGRDEQALRLSVRAKPTDALTVDAFWQHWENDASQMVVHTDAGSAAVVASFANLWPLVNPSVPATIVANRDYTTVNRFDGRLKDNANLYGLTLDYDLGDVSVTSITGYFDYDAINPLDVGAPSNAGGGVSSSPENPVRSKQFSQELLLRGDTGSLRWVTGAYYLRENVATRGGRSDIIGALFLQPAIQTIGIFFDNGQHLRSLAAYADGQLSVSDTVRLNAGIRYTNDRKVLNGFAQCFGVAMAPGCASIDGQKVTSGAVTGSAGIEADVMDDMFAYVKYARGYKAGGLNSNGGGSTYKPETIDNIEGGVKGKLLDNRIQYSLIGFYSKYKDLQAFIVPPGGATSFAVNAGAAEIYGVESTLNINPTPYLSLDTAFSWTPTAKYTQFDAVDPGLGVLTSYAGARLSRTPKFSGIVERH